MDVDARIEALQQENERLRGRIDQLEAAMGLDFLPPIEWGLTGAEARVFGVLLKRETATRDAIMAGLYRDAGKDEAEIKIVDVLVCKLRKKVKPFGLEVLTRWGFGYELSSASKEMVRNWPGATAAGGSRR